MTKPASSEAIARHVRGTQNRLGAPPRVVDRPASDDKLRADGVAKMVDAHRGSVAQQIELGQLLLREFKLGAGRYPLTHRASATELLRVYARLKELAARSKTDRSGRLLTSTPFDQTLRLWTRKGPHNVEEIPPFSPANLKKWTAAADSAAVNRPLHAPPPAPKKTVRPPEPKKDPPLEYRTIKVPGMTLSTADGRARILASVIRRASRQVINDGVARRIADNMGLLNYLVLEHGDTIESATKGYDGLPFGWTRLVKLRREFLPELQKQTTVAVAGSTSDWTPQNDFAEEYLADLSGDERTWYVIGRLANKPARDRDSGYLPGEIVSPDGIMFVGPEYKSSLFFTPTGHLFAVKQKSVRDQQLDAIVQGAKWARGGPILGYGVIAVGAAALAAPATLAFAAETLATAFGTTSAVGGIVNGIVYTRYFAWLTLNWQVAFAWGSAGVGLGIKLWNFDPGAFWEEFKESPKDALVGLGVSLIETMHDFAEAYTSTPGRGGGFHAPDDLPPTPSPKTRTPLALPPAPDDPPTPKPPSPAPARVATIPESDDLVQRRMTANALQKSAKAANDGDAPAAQAQVQTEAQQDALDLRAQRTGTDDAPVPTQSRGVTTQATASSRPTAPATTQVGNTNATRGKGTSAAGGPGPVVTPAKPAWRTRRIRNPAKIWLSDLAARRANLTKPMKAFVVRAATIYREEMRAQDPKELPHVRSTTAHDNAQNRLRAEYPDVTEFGEPLTGVTGPAAKGGQPNVRVSDATYVDPNRPKRSDTPADLSIEFKLKAYPTDDGKVLMASGNRDPRVTQDQIQAYEVGQTQLGVPVFVINERGQIYGFSRGRWSLVGGPESEDD